MTDPLAESILSHGIEVIPDDRLDIKPTDWVVCMRDDEPPYVPADPGLCVKCGHGIWLSHESGAKFVAAGGQPICMVCAGELVTQDEAPEYQVSQSTVNSAARHVDVRDNLEKRLYPFADKAVMEPGSPTQYCAICGEAIILSDGGEFMTFVFLGDQQIHTLHGSCDKRFDKETT